jgi:hypothetical protein
MSIDSATRYARSRLNESAEKLFRAFTAASAPPENYRFEAGSIKLTSGRFTPGECK